MVEMKKYKLYEVSDYVTSKVSTSQLSLQDYVTTDCLLQNKCGRECAENLPPKSAKVTAYKPGDILISNIRPYLKKIWYANSEGGNSADVLTIRAKENFEKLYIYYMLFQDSFFDYVSKGVKGSKMPRGDKNHIMNFEILVPENLQVQKKIASTLSDFDKRIENLRAQNRVLEQTAKTIYDYTFLQCAGHQTTYNKTLNRNIPAGWEVKKLGDLCSIFTGKKDVSKRIPGDYAFFSCAPEKLSSNEYLYDGQAILVSGNGSYTGRVSYYDGKFDLYQRTYACVLKNTSASVMPYLYFTMKYLFEPAYSGGTHGSAIPYIVMNDLTNYSICWNSPAIESFVQRVSPMFKKRLINLKQIEALITKRNTLLPLLMTGQVEV
jgi:type I restriction enzyme S subunit